MSLLLVHTPCSRDPGLLCPETDCSSGPQASLLSLSVQIGMAQLAGTPQAGPGTDEADDGDGEPGSVGSGILAPKKQSWGGKQRDEGWAPPAGVTRGEPSLPSVLSLQVSKADTPTSVLPLVSDGWQGNGGHPH